MEIKRARTCDSTIYPASHCRPWQLARHPMIVTPMTYPSAPVASSCTPRNPGATTTLLRAENRSCQPKPSLPRNRRMAVCTTELVAASRLTGAFLLRRELSALKAAVRLRARPAGRRCGGGAGGWGFPLLQPLLRLDTQPLLLLVSLADELRGINASRAPQTPWAEGKPAGTAAPPGWRGDRHACTHTHTRANLLLA